MSRTGMDASLSLEQPTAFADADSPVKLIGAFNIAAAMAGNQAGVQTAFRSGRDVVAGGAQARRLFCGNPILRVLSYHLPGCTVARITG